jgi:hypothetical protein
MKPLSEEQNRSGQLVPELIITIDERAIGQGKPLTFDALINGVVKS